MLDLVVVPVERRSEQEVGSQLTREDLVAAWRLLSGRDGASHIQPKPDVIDAQYRVIA